MWYVCLYDAVLIDWSCECADCQFYNLDKIVEVLSHETERWEKCPSVRDVEFNQ